MRNWLKAAGVMVISLNACNTQNAITEEQQVQDWNAYTLADVIPVSQVNSPQDAEAIQKLREESAKQFASVSTAAAYYVTEAKRNFNEENADSAAFLFGQAWLLDSTNNDVYWGYGLVYGQKKEFDKALNLLYKALENDKENPRLLTDVATSHLGRFYEGSRPDDLLQSKKLLEEAISISPELADAYYKLAISSYYLQEYGKAWEYLHRSLLQDKDIANPSFVAALLQKQPDPKGVYQQ